MRIVLMGAPGSGKGTQAQQLVARFGVPQVSTGDLLRSAVSRGTAYGLKAKEAMDAGQLVADEIVLGIIRERLAESDAARGYILDGFPRNRVQADALASMLASIGKPLDAVVLMDVDFAAITRRITGRRTCPNCGSIFNVNDAPMAELVNCPNCDAHPVLAQRPDDNEQTVSRRLEVYREQTQPLIDYYRNRGLLHVIDGNAGVEEVTERLTALLRMVDRGAMRKPAAPKKKPAGKARRPAKSGGRRAKPRKPARKTARKAARKPVRVAVRQAAKSVRKPARKVARKAVRKVARKPARKPARKSGRKSARKAARKAARGK